MNTPNQLRGNTSAFSRFRRFSIYSETSRSVTCAVVIFLYIFNLELEGMGGFAMSYLILIFAVWLPFGSIRDILRPYLSVATFVLLLFVPPLVWTAAYSYSYDSDAIVLSLLAIKTYGWSCCVALLVYDLYALGRTSRQFLQRVLQSFVFALLLQSIFILLSFYLNEFAELVNQFLVAKGNLTGLEEHRSKGLANSGGANMSMLLSFGVMAAMTVFHQVRQKRYFVIAVFISLASAMVGRSGFFVSVGFIILYWLIFESKIKLVLFAFLVAGLFSIAVNFVGIALFEADNAWGKWFFLEAETSASDLIAMVADVPDMTALLFGAGFFEEPIGLYNRTDSGFMKAIYALGVPLALYFYGVVVYVFMKGYQLFREKNNVFEPIFIYFISTIFVLVLFFFEFKESMLYQNMTGRALFLFANLALLFHLKQKRRHGQ